MASSRANDGYPTFYSFSISSSIKIWEKEVTPPGVTGGGPIDTTSMHNVDVRTQEPKSLLTLLPTKATVFYDPQVLQDIQDMIQVKQAISVHISGKGVWLGWGWIESFVPNQNKEGEAPTAEIEFQQSGTNSSGTETKPTFTPA